MDYFIFPVIGALLKELDGISKNIILNYLVVLTEMTRKYDHLSLELERGQMLRGPFFRSTTFSANVGENLGDCLKWVIRSLPFFIYF